MIPDANHGKLDAGKLDAMTEAEWADLKPSDFELDVEVPVVVRDLTVGSLTVKNDFELELKFAEYAVSAVSAVASDLNEPKHLAQLDEYFARVDGSENDLLVVEIAFDVIAES